MPKSKKEYIDFLEKKIDELSQRTDVLNTGTFGDASYAEKIYRFYGILNEELNDMGDDEVDSLFENRMDSVIRFENKLIETGDIDKEAPGKLNEYHLLDEYYGLKDSWKEKYPNLFQTFSKIGKEFDAPFAMSGINQGEKDGGKWEYSFADTQKVKKMVSLNLTGCPLFGRFFDSVERNGLRTNFTQYYCNILSDREGMVPFMTVSLIGQGCTPEDIVQGKYSDECVNFICDNFDNLSDESKREEALKNLDENYVRGLWKSFLYFDEKNTNVNKKNADMVFSEPLNIVKNALVICYASYPLDKSFDERIKATAKEMKLPYRKGEFAVEKAHDVVGGDLTADGVENLVGWSVFSLKEKNLIGKVAQYTDYVFRANHRFENMVTANFNKISEANIADVFGKDFHDWITENNTVAANYYFMKCADEGKLFQNIERDDLGNYSLQFDSNRFIKEFKEFEKENPYICYREEFAQAAKDDYITFPTIESVQKKNVLSEQKKKMMPYIVKSSFDKVGKWEEITNSFKDESDNTKVKDEFTTKATIKILKRIEAGLDNINKLIDEVKQEPEEEKNLDSLNKKKTPQKIEFEKIFNIKDDDLNFEKENKRKHNETISKESISEELNETLKSVLLKLEKVKGEKSNFDIEIPKNLDINSAVDRVKILDKQITKKDEFKTTSVTSLLTKRYAEFAKQLKATSQLDDKGDMTGNSTLFTEMYTAIEEVSKYNSSVKSDEGLSEKLNTAREKIAAYVEKRDTLIKFTQKGRNRIKLAKDMLNISEMYTEEYGKYSDKVSSEEKKFNARVNSEKISLGKEDKKESLVTKSVSLSKEKNLGIENSKG